MYGAVLITTRNRNYVGYSPDSHIQVTELSETEAIELLHKVANIVPSSNDESIKIVRELGLLALAITQAGAYIFKTGQLNNYLAIFQKHRDELMRDGSLQGRNYDRSTYAAFDLSFGLLPEKTQEFMKICAFFHHSLIPQALFAISTTSHFRSYLRLDGCPRLPETENLVSILEDIFGSKWDEFVFQELIGPVMRGSLIDQFADGHQCLFYNIHPLVQSYVQDLLKPVQRDRYALLAGKLLLGAVRPFKESNIWNFQLLPHIDSLPARVRQIHIRYAETFADVYDSVGRWNSCLSLRKYCHSELDRQLGERHPRTISSKSQLGQSLYRYGHLEEAENTQREVLELQKKILGALHPNTITEMYNIAITFADRGQLEEAEKTSREVLELRTKILGSHHPHTIHAMQHLASTLHERGQLEEAEKMKREVLMLGKKILGPRHPDTVTALNNLANTLTELGQLDEAEKIRREVLEVREKILGQRHPRTTNARHNLAVTLQKDGQLEDAEEIQRVVLKVRKEVLGLQHPHSISGMGNLACTLYARGQLDESEKMCRDVLKLRMEFLGFQHPYTITAMHNIACILGDRGQFEEAEKINREVLALRMEILGPHHPHTISVIHNLANVLSDRNQIEESERLKRQIPVFRKEILGRRRFNTISIFI
jgi:tetratricopeptide (TPR) repeat protein